MDQHKPTETDSRITTLARVIAHELRAEGWTEGGAYVLLTQHARHLAAVLDHPSEADAYATGIGAAPEALAQRRELEARIAWELSQPVRVPLLEALDRADPATLAAADAGETVALAGGKVELVPGQGVTGAAMARAARGLVCLTALVSLACGCTWSADPCPRGQHEETECHMVAGEPTCAPVCVPDSTQEEPTK